jgi:hypothetical protein
MANTTTVNTATVSAAPGSKTANNSATVTSKHKTK